MAFAFPDLLLIKSKYIVDALAAYWISKNLAFLHNKRKIVASISPISHNSQFVQIIQDTKYQK